MIEIAKFFRTHRPPVDAEETIQIYAFMQAAQLSKEREGVPVSIAEVMEIAGKEAKELLAGKLSR